MINRKPILTDLGLRETDFPSDLIIETNAFCDLTCTTCPSKNLQRKRGLMDLETLALIAEEAADYPDTRLWFAFMGEPLLAAEATLSMINYATDIGCENLYLNTNGRHAEGEIAERLMRSGLKQIIVSIDGATAETYNAIRQGGDFKRVQDNTLNLLAHRRQSWCAFTPEIVVQMIVQDRNAHEVEAFKRFWLAQGAIVKLRLKTGWGTVVPTEDLDGQARTFPCPWLVRALPILWDGRFVMCDADFEGRHVVGNIHDMSIREAWTIEHRKYRQAQWSGDYSHPLCAECKDWAVGKSQFYYPST